MVGLDEFKDAYLNLLERSKEKINNKDFTADAKMLGIEETDPSKWSYEDVMRYREFWNSKKIEILNRLPELRERTTRMSEEVHEEKINLKSMGRKGKTLYSMLEEMNQ